MSAAEARVLPMYAEEPRVPSAKPDDKPSIYVIVKAANCKGIPTGTKEVLAQVCNITEYGSHKCFDGNLATLADKLGMSRPKVSLHLKRLVSCGLLLVSDTGKRTKRSYRPCPELVSAYQLGNTLEVAEVIRSTYHSVTNSRTTVLPSTYHSATNNSKEEKEEDKVSTVPIVEASHAFAADAALIAEMQAEIARLQELLETEQASTHHYASRYADEVKAHQKTQEELERVKNPNKGKGKLIADTFVAWYTQRIGIEPPMQVKDYVAALSIFNYLRRVSLEQSDEGAANSFAYILSQWDRLEDFHQKQPNLAAIYSNLANIIATLKHGKAKPTTTASGLALTNTDALADALRACKELGLD